MANAKNNIHLSDLQFGRNNLINTHLSETLTSVKSQTDNFMIKSLIGELGNPLNPFACRLLPITKLEGDARALSEVYFKMIGIKGESLKDLAKFAQYNKDCVDNQDILNKIADILSSGKYTDKSCANIFANTVVGKSSFFFSGFQLGMKFANLSDEQLEALIAKDCLKNPYTREKKYGTPKDAQNFKNSELMKFVQYCDRIGFVYEIIHDDMLSYLDSHQGSPYIPEAKIKEYMEIVRVYCAPTLNPEANQQYKELRETFPNGRQDYRDYLHKDEKYIDHGWMAEVYSTLAEGAIRIK